MKKFILSFLLVAMATPGQPAKADDAVTVQGQAGVTDGDTIRIASAIVSSGGRTNLVANVKIRLHGIDAPERRQICFDAHDKAWHCGEVAARYLADLVKNLEVTCVVKDIDRYNRLVAVCQTTNTPDINASLVTAGLAIAYRNYSLDYVSAEEQAHARATGLWAGRFDFPWDWRKAH